MADHTSATGCAVVRTVAGNSRRWGFWVSISHLLGRPVYGTVATTWSGVDENKMHKSAMESALQNPTGLGTSQSTAARPVLRATPIQWRLS
jgi:hypothetical protein